MLIHLSLLISLSAIPLVAVDLPGDAAIKQMKERGPAAAEDLSRSYGIDGFATDIFHKDESLLALAVQSGNLQAVKWFLDHGAKIDGHDSRGMPLWFAAFHKNLMMVKLLLAHGAKPKVIQGRVDMIEPAVRTGQIELTKLLLDNGAAADYRVVLSSCNDTDTAMTRYLLTRIEITPEWMTRCMDSALEKDKFDTVRFFLTEKKTALSDATVFIALASLIRRNSAMPPEMLSEIINRAVNINVSDTTYFHYISGDDSGFSFDDKTAVMIAAFYNRTDILKQLMTRNPDLNAQTPGRKYTALHYATIRCHKETVDLLLDHKVDLSRNDIFAKTPLNYAAGNCPREIAAQLESAGGQKTILTRSTKRDVRNVLFHYGIPIAYTIFAVAMREAVYKDNPQDNWFGRVNGPLATAFLLGPLPAFILVQSKSFGLLGGILAPYIAVIGGIAGLTLGFVYNERFNDNRGIYYASVVPIYSFTLAQFFF
jgi:ankyrin repeat protein